MCGNPFPHCTDTELGGSGTFLHGSWFTGGNARK